MKKARQSETSQTALTAEQLEKYSSAVTLSDMEIFIFPELLYSLVLANIMSPRLWRWRDDPWFKKIDSMTPYRRVLRLKQYIIDHYAFNLDLDTWGLTTQEKELERFKPWIDKEMLGRSNALFGYQGDQYYFDLDIRKHFGLDKYTINVIPYWKTETIEAMDAFQLKEGYPHSAGECVSLSTLYAAALFVVCKIPLENIYLMATPLHSQNFIDVDIGVLSNNRRIVTQRMWFNGTELTAKAQRALRNEQVTIVTHNTGYIHVLYPDATIDQDDYTQFKQKLQDYLTIEIYSEILANFLRQHSHLQTCFQVRHDYHGKSRFIPAEKAYAYEHISPYRMNDGTRKKLLEEIDEYEFFYESIEGRIPLNKFDEFFKLNKIDLNTERHQRKLMEEFNCFNARAWDILQDLITFTRIEPKLPGQEKKFLSTQPIEINTEMKRDEIISYLEQLRSDHPVANLSFYAYRDLSRTEWAPFMKAAIERNPVILEATKKYTDHEIIEQLEAIPNESIYEGSRLAQPDEVWNFQRGDGLERAICLATIWKNRNPDATIRIEAKDQTLHIHINDQKWIWKTDKKIEVSLDI